MRRETITQKVETPFGSMYVHVEFDDDGTFAGGAISDPGKDRDANVALLVAALSQGLDEALTDSATAVFTGVRGVSHPGYRFDPALLDEIRARLQLVATIERDVPLRRAGCEYQARCPFHAEKSPSFTVAPAKGFFHCFGCSAHGDVIDFVRLYNGWDFVGPARHLADRLLRRPRPVGPEHAAARPRHLAASGRRLGGARPGGARRRRGLAGG